MKTGTKRKSADWVLLLVVLFLIAPTPAIAHGGGFPRLRGIEAGPYRLYAWSQPDPWRVDQELHLTIGVTTLEQTSNGENAPTAESLVSDATVTVRFTPPVDQPGTGIQREAVATESLGGIYYETDVLIPMMGDWRVNVSVQGAAGAGEAEFEATVLATREVNWWLVAGGSVLILALLGLAALIGRMK